MKNKLINNGLGLRFAHILTLVCLISFTSCLEYNLDELPAFSDADILEMRFEYRWYDEIKNVMMVQPLTTKNINDKENKIIKCEITVPEASGFFTNQIRSNVNLSNITGFCNISPAASIKPIEGSPLLGKVSDFSKPEMKYLLTAADGTTKTWILKIDAFKK
jgi:hypothetical protein